jgi:hypothetical protein
MNDVVVITALSGNREKLRDPKIVFPGVDYVAFVDVKQDTSIWEQRPLLDFTFDNKYKNRRNAKIYKILPHLFFPNHKVHIWHDVSHGLVRNPIEVISLMGNSDVGVFKHSQRNCIYQEANVLKELNYDYPELIDAQISHYKSLGYPENNGLYELPVSVRRNTERVQKMNLKWFEIISKFSSRDQISFPVCLWQLGINPFIFDGRANGHNPDGSIGCNNILPQIYQHVSSGA